MADGRVFTGEQALALGLVDKIGTLGDAVERAGELSGLGRKPSVVERQPESAIPLLLGVSARQFWQEFSRGSASYEYRGLGE
jgi:protease-4